MPHHPLRLLIALALSTLAEFAIAQQDEVTEVLVLGRQRDLIGDALSASEGLLETQISPCGRCRAWATSLKSFLA